jgi:uncharacterized protein involved in exopolysaccharide biosynthesis
MSRPAPPPELDAEREVDLARAAQAVAARWWLLLLGLVAGVIVGWFAAVGGTDVYRASALIYTGFPLAVGGGPLPSVNSTPATVRQIVQSEAVIQRVARASGLPPDELRSGISLSAPSGGTRAAQAQTMQISVKAGARRKTRLAANGLARIVVGELGQFVDGKIDNYARQVASYEQALDAVTQSIEVTTRALRGGNLSTTERLILLSTLGTSEAQRARIEADLFNAQGLLTQAREFEKPSVLSPAVPREVTARSKRSSLVVAGAIGLLLGLVAALAWEPVARAVRRT